MLYNQSTMLSLY